MPQFSYRISKTRPLPNENINKSVFTAETMRDAQKIVNKRISENLPKSTQMDAWEVSKDSDPLIIMQNHGKDSNGKRYTVTLLVIEP